MSRPYYLNAKATKLGAGPDDSLEPSESPTESLVRSRPPGTWPVVNRAAGPNGPPDRPAGPPPTDPAERGLPPFSWPRYLGIPTLDFDPDIALWPQVPLSRWPFTGPPTTGIWPLGWMGVDNTATIWVCMVAGQPGTWLPLGPGDTLGIVTPQAFGAVGDGVHDDTAAVLAAIAAASPGGTSPAYGQGGVVYFPPGVYACSAALFYYPNTIWQGAGCSATQIKMTTDLWAGGSALAAAFISAAGGLSGPGEAQQKNWVMRDIAVQGPGTPTIGQATCRTNGIQGFNGAFILENLHIEGFYAGLEMVGNHSKLYNIYSTRNYYGVDYSDNVRSLGNDAYFSCILSGNDLASIHVGGPNMIETATFYQTHLGFGPVGIFKTDSQNGWDVNLNPVYTGGAVSTQHMLYSCIFDGCSFESIGNCAILDMATGVGGYSLMFSTVFRDIAFSWNTGAFQTTSAPLNSPLYQGAWTLVLRRNSPMSRIEDGSVLTAGMNGVLNLTILNSSPPTFVFGSAPSANFLGSGTNWSNTHPGWGHHQVENFNGGLGLINGGQLGRLITANATTLINVGDCVELIGSSTVQRATGTKPVWGIARTPSPGTQAVTMLIQVEGFCPVNSTVNGVTAGSVLYTDATTTYMVNNTNVAGRAVGQSMSTMGTGSINCALSFKIA